MSKAPKKGTLVMHDSSTAPTATEWFENNVPNDRLYYASGCKHQITFARNVLGGLVANDLDYEVRNSIATVISTHRSKSVLLPVFSLKRLGLQLILRNNFYNWKMSVVSDNPIETDFSGLFHTIPPLDPDYTGDPLSSVYFEGFPESLVFGYYGPSDKRLWSAEIFSDHELWCTVFLISRALGYIRPAIWATKESVTLKRAEIR